MSRLNHALEDLHLPGSPITKGPANTRDDYRTYGWRQLLCAWFIVLTIAALFKVSDLIYANLTASSARANNLAQIADVEQTRGEIERWERGEPRQGTITVRGPREIVLVSRIDQ
jgi:hypothetical protein